MEQFNQFPSISDWQGQAGDISTGAGKASDLS